MRKTSQKTPIQGIKLNPEEEFIIMTLRRVFSANERDAQNYPLSKDVNSEAIYNKSREWRITPILFHALTIRKSRHHPSGGLEKLIEVTRNDYLRTSVVNEGNYEKLSGILQAFRESGIKVLLLKGIHLARFVYRDVGLRPMGDVDILVRKEDLNSAEEIMFRLGYKYAGPLRSANGSGENSSDTITKDTPDLYYELYKVVHHHLRQFVNPAGIQVLEVHWGLMKPHLPFEIDVDGLWERAEKMKMGEHDVFVLSPEDLLLYLSMHIACSDELKKSGLRPYCDIAYILKHYLHRIDWNILKRRAHEWGAAKYLFLTLLLSQEILGFSLPPGLLDSIRPRSFNERILLQAKKRILQKDTEIILCIGKLGPDISAGRKFIFVLRRIFLPAKLELASRYSISPSSSRLYLYYFVRIVSFLYHKTPFYIRFFLYTLKHKKSDFHKFNLDSWLMTSDSEKSGS